MKIYIVFFLFFAQTFGQNVLFHGKLIDKETKEPIVYANISFINSNKGISSKENGEFELTIDEKLLQSKVHVSCLNYQDTILTAIDLQNKTLSLKPKIFYLEEIILTKKVSKELVVDKYSRNDIKGGFSGLQSAPWIITKYFNYKDEYKETPYLKEIWVYFGSMIMRRKSKFRIRLYKKDTKTGLPSDDLINENVIVFSSKIDGKVKVDISKHNIDFPKEGFFIGLERIHIPYNFHEFEYTTEGSKKKHKAIEVSPSFGAVQTKDTTIVFSQGKWRKFYYPKEFNRENQIQPAISLTLSN